MPWHDDGEDISAADSETAAYTRATTVSHTATLATARTIETVIVVEASPSLCESGRPMTPGNSANDVKGRRRPACPFSPASSRSW